MTQPATGDTRPHHPDLLPGDPDSWRAVLDAAVETGRQAYIDGCRRLAAGIQAQLRESFQSRVWSIAAGLLSGSRRGLRGPALDAYLTQCTAVIPEALLHTEDVTPEEAEEARRLAARPEELAELTRQLGSGFDIAAETRPLDSKLLVPTLPRAFREAGEDSRRLIDADREAFRTVAFFDPGQEPSKVSVALAVLVAYEDGRVPYSITEPRGPGRRPNVEARLAESLVLAMPPRKPSPAVAVRRWCGTLSSRATDRAIRAARRGIGLEAIPGRYEVLLRLLAIVGDVDARAALQPGRKQVQRKRLRALQARIERHVHAFRHRRGEVPADLFSLLQAGLVLGESKGARGKAAWILPDSTEPKVVRTPDRA